MMTPLTIGLMYATWGFHRAIKKVKDPENPDQDLFYDYVFQCVVFPLRVLLGVFVAFPLILLAGSEAGAIMLVILMLALAFAFSAGKEADVDGETPLHSLDEQLEDNARSSITHPSDDNEVPKAKIGVSWSEWQEQQKQDEETN